MQMKLVTSIFCAAFALIYGVGCFYYPSGSGHTAESNTLEDGNVLEDKDIRVLVEKLPDSSRLVGTGSGFLVTQDGYLLTNHHVVEKGNRFLIKTDEGGFKAELIKSSRENDLALLKVTGLFAPMRITDSSKARLGQEVFTVGFPNISIQGLSPKLTQGSISSTSGMEDDPRFFQISVPVQPGNSGGALCDKHGNVVGIISSVLVSASSMVNYQNVNYAIKSSVAVDFLFKSPAKNKITLFSRNVKYKADSLDAIAEAQQATALILVYQAPEEELDNDVAQGDPLDALENWLVLIDTGNLDAAWQVSSQPNSSSTERQKFMDKMSRIDRLMGKRVSRQLLSKKISYGKTSGDSVAESQMAVRFSTSCENIPQAMESVVLVRERDGNWRVSDYSIQ